MATSEPNSAASIVDYEDGPRTWGDIATRVAWSMAQNSFPRGDLAELRRMSPRSIDSPVLLRLRADQELFGSSRVDSLEIERKWALILHGLALMTPRSGGEGEPRTAHDGQIPVGRALYFGGEATRDRGFYSEARLKRLLSSRGEMTRTLLARTFRMLAAARVTFSWREMANFIYSDGFNDEAAERHRRRIAREYFQAQYRSQPDKTDGA